MKKISGFVIISVFLTFAYFVGLLKFLSENEEDRCEMTYMFEYPQYVKISNKADKEFIKYGLYAYSEGRHTEKSRNMRFDGIPVLFIPGNAGSHKQVRSLSSIALRKWLNSRTPFHFDYFTVDLNEEYSGVYGPLLFDQLQYVSASLFRILELYHGRQYPPKSVVVIGHSMGGVIAMKLLSELQQPELIPILITLAAPLKRPPLNLDYHTNNFYEGIFDNGWNTTSIFSVAGGYRDFIVAPLLTARRGHGITHAMTTNIPISWTESNHVQILWCKQVAMALNRALFDSVDIKTHQISTNVTYRDMVFKHHLVQHSGTKVRNRENYFKSVQMSSKGQWIENLHKGYSIKYPNGVNEPHWYMVALSDIAGYEELSILAVNLEVSDWVFVCNAYFFKQSSRICREGFHLSHKSEIAPSVKYKRRFFNINMVKLKKYRKDLTHVIFRALPTDEPLEYHVDVHGSGQRSLTVNLPSWFSLTNQVILERTTEKAIYYELALPQLNNIIQYYRLVLEPVECSKNEHHASVTLAIPWSNENYHGFVTNNMKKPFNIRLYSSKPADLANMTAVIKLILDPSCTYKISVQSSIFGVLGQFARTYTPLLLANMAAVVLLSLRHQLKKLEKGYCSILFVAIQEGARPYYVLPAYVLSSRLLSLTFLPDFLLKPDYMHLVNDGVDFFMLPLLLFTCSLGFFWILTVIFSVSLIAMESTVHKLCLKLLARTVSFNMAWSDYLMSYLHKIPVVVALTLISLSLTTCGGLALCLGAVFYFLRLTQMSQDFVEEVVWYIVKKVAKKIKRFFAKNKTKRNPANERMLTNIQDTNREEVHSKQIELKNTEIEEHDGEREEKDITNHDVNTAVQHTKVKEHNIMIQVQENNFVDKGTETTVTQGTQVNNRENNELSEDADNINHIEEYQKYEEKYVDTQEEPQEIQEKVQNCGDGDKIKEMTILDDSNRKKTEKETGEQSTNNLEDFDTTSESADRESVEIRRNNINRTHESTSERQNDKNTDDKYSKDPKPSDEGPELSSAYNAIFFHSTLFFLWCIVTVINIPAVLTWAHNFKYSTILEPDDSFIPGLALSVCALILWQLDLPKPNRKWMGQLEKFVLTMAVLCLVFATISIYRLNYILTITIVIITLHQLFAPQMEEVENEDDFPEKIKYSDLKRKVE